MMLPTAKKWNDQSVLQEESLKTLLNKWHVVEDEGHIDAARMRQRVLNDILRCPRDRSVLAWLKMAFQPRALPVDSHTVKIYLDFFSKLKSNYVDALQYINAERHKHGLSLYLDKPKPGTWTEPKPALPSMKFSKSNKKNDIDAKVGGKAMHGVSAGADEYHETTGTEERNQPSSSSAHPSETLVLQRAQDHVPMDASHEAYTEVSSNKRKGLEPEMSDVRGGCPDSTGCLDRALMNQVPSIEPSRSPKRRKVDHSPITRTADSECHLPPSKSSSASNEVPRIEDGMRRKSIGATPAKETTGRIKKTPRRSQPEANHSTHLLQAEGEQQAQDSQPMTEGNLVTTTGGQLDSHLQSSPAVLASEGPRAICSWGGNNESVSGPEQLGSHSGFTDLTVLSRPKLVLPQLPPIWAESRQEVCEAFDWFRSYQGGVYHADNAVKGYLLSAFASKRDVFNNNGRLIISHGGGKSESIGYQKGVSVSHQATDQLADDKSVRSLLNNYHTGRPLVLLVDDKYALFPYDLSSKDVTYAVLGFYSIVYAWAEFQPAKNAAGRVVRYKFAFRWCEEQGTPWWCFTDNTGDAGLISKESNDSKNTTGVPRIVSEDEFPPKSVLSTSQMACPSCGSHSRKVYSTWACLATDCEMFWKNPQTRELLPDGLEYDKEFLASTSRLPLPIGLNLVLDTTVTRAVNGTSTSYAFTRGIHCPECGRLSCRYQWEQLECRACNWTKKADIDIRSASDLWCDRLPINFEYFQMSEISDFVIQPMRSFMHQAERGVIQSFTLPYNRGFVHHIRTPSATGMLAAGEIFQRYQEDAKSGRLRFRRWPLKAHKCRGTLLTNYFSHNAGEPYQYVGGDANTVPFEQAPVVMSARQLIQDRLLQALDKAGEFNEVLSVAYMERQKMAFHSDAEVGLGPLVASLSLGSPALMHFRLHARHDPHYEQRGVLLTLVLRHGDILVMDGNGVQEYYEHTVVPNNFRIAATARQITPNHPHSVNSHPDMVKDDDGI